MTKPTPLAERRLIERVTEVAVDMTDDDLDWLVRVADRDDIGELCDRIAEALATELEKQVECRRVEVERDAKAGKPVTMGEMQPGSIHDVPDYTGERR